MVWPHCAMRSAAENVLAADITVRDFAVHSAAANFSKLRTFRLQNKGLFSGEYNILALFPNCLNLLYSRKYWRSIKFGGLAVGEATVKFKSVKFKCDLRVYALFYACACAHNYYMYGTTAKFKSANIFISAARDQTAKFKDRQYFQLYGMWKSVRLFNRQNFDNDSVL